MKWINRNFANLWTSYATYYFGKVNLSLIIPLLIVSYGLSKHQLGAVASAFLFAYAVGQFLHGFFSERFNPFTYMSLGLMLSAMMNTILGFSGGLFFILFFGEMMDGFFQSMGWSSCVRATSTIHIKEKEKATTILGTSYQVGNSVAWLITGFVIHYLGWQWGFWFAAIIMFLRGITLQINKPDIPRTKRTTSQQIKKTLILPVILAGTALAILNFVRYGVIVWVPLYLFEVHNLSIAKVGLKIFLIPVAGCIGTLLYNKFGKSKEVLTILYMIGLMIVIGLYPFTVGFLSSVLIVASGFFLYGPHVFFVTTVPGRYIDRKITASSTGTIDGMGYIGAMLTGVIVPFILKVGWNEVFYTWSICCIVIILLSRYIMRGTK